VRQCVLSTSPFIFTCPTVLDQLIDDFADLIRNAYNLKELADPGETSEVRQSTAFHVGMR